MAIVPIVLRLQGVTSNYDFHFVLTTPGVSWSMGEGGEDHLGISYNATAINEKCLSSIQRIEFTGSTLTICTGPSVGDAFTLTAFIDVPDDARWLQGYCIKNEKASVLARLGDFAPVEWQDEINCAIPILLPEIRRATFMIHGIKQYEAIRINLAEDASSPDDGVVWCVAPIDSPEIGLIIKSARADVVLPLMTCRLDAKRIDLTIGSALRRQGPDAGVIVEAYIARIRRCRYSLPARKVRLKVECDESVIVTARIENHRPQYLAQTYKLFSL
jgi:hypothetical protein